ncbi:MAG: hypothetical protein AAB658_03490, partial [Chloroflexota bacterium]
VAILYSASSDATICAEDTQAHMSKRKRQHPHAHLLRLADLLETVNVPPPLQWPGANDPGLARPDMVKFEMAELAANQEPGKSKMKQLEDAFRKGPLGELDDIEHWAMEEFFWHGLPGDDWRPMDAYLASVGDHFSPPAQEQLRRWKEARIGLYEVGDVHDGTVGLQEWDPASGAHCGQPMRAITLNIGGVNVYRRFRGYVTLTYVAPWAPTENLFCGMGYGATPKKHEIGIFELVLQGLRQPERISQPYPWAASREQSNKYLRQWQMREWHGWLKERLVFPFRALVQTAPKGKPEAKAVTGLLPMEPAAARQMGIYLEVPLEGKQLIMAGMTTIIPLDVDSPNWRPIAEYQEYRRRVGPPRGTIGQPGFVQFR